MNFKGKTAIVTGASKGIGKAVAMRLGELGANVVINYSRDEKGAQEVVGKINEMKGRAISMQADVSSADDAKAMIKKTIDEFGSVHILINNAGITRDTLLMRMKEEDWNSVIDTNLKGVFNCTKAVTR